MTSDHVEGGRGPRALRFAVRAGAGLLGLALILLGILYVVAVRPAEAALPPAKVEPAATAAERYRQDLAYLRRLPEADRSFTPATRLAFEQEVDRLSAAADSLDPPAFELGVTRAVALAGNGHTYVRGVAMGRSLPAVPLRWVWFSDGLYVVAARGAYADLVGSRVLELNGRPPEQLAAALAPYVGGRDTRKRLFSVSLLAAPAALRAAGLGDDANAVQAVLQQPDGQTWRGTLVAEDRPAMAEDDAVRWPAMDLLPETWPAAGGWRHVLAGVPERPLYLQRGERWVWWAQPAPDTLFVSLRRGRSRPGDDIKAALGEALAAAARSRPNVAIVDLRANTGGSYELAAPFAKRLPELLPPDGRLYILVGPDTFSAGLVTVAQLKHHGGRRAVIVGTPMGDFPRFWAEGGRVELPNSRLVVRYATAMHDWEKGCGPADVGRCYWMNYLSGVAAGDLNPAIAAPLSFADYLAGRDPAMAAVARDLEGVRGRGR